MTMRVLTITVLLCTALALSGATDSVDSPRVKKHLGCAHCHHGCPVGWTQLGSVCFRYVDLWKTWSAAEAHCRQLGGHLASLHNFKEFNLVKQLTSEEAWIGGTDAEWEGHWQWTDGSGFHFAPWNKGEPNDARTGEDCLCINFSGTDGLNDYFCTRLLRFICQIY